MTLQLLHSEFPYIRGKFSFLFISVPALSKNIDMCENQPEKFYIYSKIFDRDVGSFVRHPDIVILLHLFSVSNFSSNFFSVYALSDLISYHKAGHVS
jgi:hypothetical protein